jgi:plasmid stabilization system protein ParE
MRYRYSENAKLELVDAAGYYDLQRPGLGTEFAVEVGIGIAKVLDAPNMWPEIEEGFRRYRIDRFPYALVYRIIEARNVEIVSVFDLRRRPGSWHQNLK